MVIRVFGVSTIQSSAFTVASDTSPSPFRVEAPPEIVMVGTEPPFLTSIIAFAPVDVKLSTLPNTLILLSVPELVIAQSTY